MNFNHLYHFWQFVRIDSSLDQLETTYSASTKVIFVVRMRSPRSSIAPVLVAGILVLALLLVSPEQATGTPVSGRIATDTTWMLAGSPYWVEGDVVVLSTANLTIEPGVRVLFDGLLQIRDCRVYGCGADFYIPDF